MQSQNFEETVAQLLKAMGFTSVERVGGTADRGVDVICYKPDEFGFKLKYVVQCKNS